MPRVMKGFFHTRVMWLLESDPLGLAVGGRDGAIQPQMRR